MIRLSNEAMEKERADYEELSQHIEMYFIDINNFQVICFDNIKHI